MDILVNYLPIEIVEKIAREVVKINYRFVVYEIKKINNMLLEGLYFGGLYSTLEITHKMGIESIDNYFNSPISNRDIHYWDYKSELILDFAKGGEFSQWVTELYENKIHL